MPNGPYNRRNTLGEVGPVYQLTEDTVDLPKNQMI